MGCCSTKIEKEEKKHLNAFISIYKNKRLKLSLYNYSENFQIVKNECNSNYKKLSKNHSLRTNFVKEICDIIDDYFNTDKYNILTPTGNITNVISESKTTVFYPTENAHNKCLYHILLLSILLTNYLEEEVMRLELSQLLFRIISTIHFKNFNNKFQQAEYMYFLYDSMLIFVSLKQELDSLFNINKFLLFIDNCNNLIQSTPIGNQDGNNTNNSQNPINNNNNFNNESSSKRKVDFKNNNNNNNNNEGTTEVKQNFKSVFLAKSLYFSCLIIQKTSLLVLKEETVEFIVRISLINLVTSAEEVHASKQLLHQFIKEAEFGVNYYNKTNTTEVSVQQTNPNQDKEKAIELIKKLNQGLDVLCKFFIRFIPDLSTGKRTFNVVRNHLYKNISDSTHRNSCLDYLLNYVLNFDFNGVNYINYNNISESKEGKVFLVSTLRSANSFSCPNSMIKNFKNILSIIINEDDDNYQKKEMSILRESSNNNIKNKSNKEDTIKKQQENNNNNNNNNTISNKEIANNNINTLITKNASSDVPDLLSNNLFHQDIIGGDFDGNNNNNISKHEEITEYSMAINPQDLANVNDSIGIGVRISDEFRGRNNSVNSIVNNRYSNNNNNNISKVLENKNKSLHNSNKSLKEKLNSNKALVNSKQCPFQKDLSKITSQNEFIKTNNQLNCIESNINANEYSWKKQSPNPMSNDYLNNNMPEEKCEYKDKGDINANEIDNFSEEKKLKSKNNNKNTLTIINNQLLKNSEMNAFIELSKV